MAYLLTDSPLGTLTIAGNGRAVTGVWFEDHHYPPSPDTLGAFAPLPSLSR